MRSKTVTAALLVLPLALGACGGGSEGEVVGPIAPNPELELGASVYASACASCHGADLTGTGRGPSHLSNFYNPNHHSDASFESAIAFGAPQHHWNFGDMPPIQGLSNEEVSAVIAFVRSEQQTRGFEG